MDCMKIKYGQKRKVMSILLFCLFSLLPMKAQQSYTLRQLTDSALQNNFAIRSAQASVAVAQEQRREAFTKYFPNVSAVGVTFNANRGMAKMDIDPSALISPEMGATLAQILPPEALAAMASPMSMTMMKNGTIASVTAMQPVFAGGQIVNGNRLAKVGEEVAQLQLQLSENEVEKTVSEYYWQLVSLREKQKTLAAVEALLGDLHKDADVAVRAGVALRNDQLQVELRQNDIQSQKIKLQNGIDIVKLLLGQYTGIAHDFDVIAPDTAQQEHLLPSPPEEVAGVRLLPEYQLLGKQVEAAKLQKKMAVGQNLPSVAVGAGYNYHNLLKNNRTFAMVMATVSIPISNWWGGSHAINRRKIEYQKAIDEQQDKSELLQIRMKNAWNSVCESRQQMEIAQRSIEQAKENLRLNRDFYRAGTSRMSDLLEAQLLYQQALDRHIEAYAEHQLKLLEYKQAAGIGN